MSKVVIEAGVPDELLDQLLQHIRAFDDKHHMRCRFAIMISTDLSTSEMIEAIESAGFDHVDVYQVKKQEQEH